MLGEGFHSDEMEVHLHKSDPNESGSLDRFAFVIWYVDEEVYLDSADEAYHFVDWGCKVSLMDPQWEVSFAENGTGAEKDIFEGCFKFAAYDARNKTDSTYSAYWGGIGGRSGSDLGASDQAIFGNWLEIRSRVINEWWVFILWHSVHMSWNSVDFRRKYTRWTQDGPKRLWISPRIIWTGPRIDWPILSILMGCWYNKNIQLHSKIHYFWSWLVCFYHWNINVEIMGQPIQGHI